MPEHPTAMDGHDPEESGPDELGTLVLRAWREPTAEEGLRVRILASRGPAEPASVAVHSDPEDVLAAVRTWLLAQARQPQG